ncbi:MAG: HPr(Ser) kinase/phosphatase [Guyparkeria sp.]|uniref:HPr(Ser) kinase/phosphatase n=1 Tax=Guyparkeria sp. TaxID=2035736 RepID=UPI0039782A16
MTDNTRHRHLTASPDDAEWQEALPPDWSEDLRDGERLVGPANPWIPTRIALIDRYLRESLNDLAQANGPDTRRSPRRLVVLTEMSQDEADRWLEQHGRADGPESATLVISTPEGSGSVARRLRRLCGRAPREWRHGVFMEISGLGVLIRGAAGIGKSEVALELITRGHRLVADDAPCFHARGNEVTGSCPDRLFGLLEVRGIGILDIRELFGANALKARKYLRLIVDLYPADSGKPMGADQRLFGDRGAERIAGREIPVWRLPVAPGRNLAVLLEAIVRQRNLERQRGSRPASDRVASLLSGGDDDTDSPEKSR